MNHLWMSQEVVGPTGTDCDDTCLLQILRTICRLFLELRHSSGSKNIN